MLEIGICAERSFLLIIELSILWDAEQTYLYSQSGLSAYLYMIPEQTNDFVDFVTDYDLKKA